MQIFIGACVFSVAVLLLAYLPGKFLLLFLKRKLSPLEDISLACSVGLLISGIAYWLIAFFQHANLYFLWPLTVAVAFAFLHGPRWKTLLIRPSPSDGERESEAPDRSGLALSAVIALGVLMLALLPQYYTNLTLRTDGTMRASAVYDAFFHLAVANELTHSIPPQAPVFAGRPLNYHYGMDLVVAMFANATGLNTADLLLRFVATLFLVLSMLNVHCFARAWFNSGYFAALVVFFIFFGEEFSFIPGLLRGEKADWSVKFFSVPTVLSLFYINPMLPAVGLLFAGFFCLQKYLRERSGVWLFLAALLFVALMEVKLFTAAHIVCCLGIGGVVYLAFFRTTDLLKVAALTACLTVPLVLNVFLQNKSGADFATTFSPWPYVSIAMNALGMKDWFTNEFTFATIALPIFLIGCLGLRIIGVPATLSAIIHPSRESGLRFVLALFVVIGVVITLTCRIVPVGFENAYNNSVWFFAQSKYVSWIFAVEFLQKLYHRFAARTTRPALVASVITAMAMALSIPATVQQFALEFDSPPAHGGSVTTGLGGYDKEVLGVTDYLKKQTQPGDVVLPDNTLLGPVTALTKCRVPVGYYSFNLVSRSDFAQRSAAQVSFWNAWRLGKVRDELLREANVRYIVVDKGLSRVPSTLPATLSEVFSNSECAVFKVGWK